MPRGPERWWNAERLAVITQARAAGLGYRWVAAQLGVTRAAVCGAYYRFLNPNPQVRVDKPPRVRSARYGTDDSAFIETWAERKARRAAEKGMP